MQKDRSINILFLIDKFNGPGGGTEKHLACLASGLDRKKFKCTVAFFGGNGGYSDLLEKEGVRCVLIPLNRIYGPESLSAAVRLARIIRDNRIDIVQTYHFQSDTFGVLVARLLGVSNIISSRRDTGELKKPRQVFLNKIMNRYIDHYIMVCDTVGKMFTKNEGIPQYRMTTIYNGVDLKRFSLNGMRGSDISRRDLGIKEDTFVLGAAALFRPEKGFDVLLDGIKKASPYMRNWRVLLIGDGWDGTFEKCKMLCTEKGLDNIVTFTGYVPEVEKYLPLMDVFCLVPTKNEGLSNAILEAAAMGRPVIATDVGGNAEAVAHNVTGLIIPPADSESLAEAVLTLFADRAKRMEMGEKARERAEKEFSLERMIVDHENLYEEILSGLR